MFFHPLWTSYFFAVISAAIFVVPALFRLVGIGHVASGFFALMEHIRWIFVLISVVMLCVAFYRVYVQRSVFASDGSLDYSRRHFWVATIIILILLTIQQWGPTLIH